MKRVLFDSVDQMKPLRLLVLSFALAVVLGGCPAQATLVAKWNFNDLNDSSPEDKENNKLELQKGGKLKDGMLVAEKVPPNDAAATVQLPNKSEILFTGNQEFTVWVRLQILTKASGKFASFYFIMSEEEGGGWMLRPEDRDSLSLRARASGLGQQIFNVHGQTDNNNKYADGKFHEFALVRRDGEGFVWMDGEIDGRASTQGNLTAGALQYGIWVSRNGRPGWLIIDGLVEEMRLYDTALSDAHLDAIEPDPLSVDTTGKVATTWGGMKARY